MSVAYSFPKSGTMKNSLNSHKLKRHMHLDLRKLKLNKKDSDKTDEKSGIFLDTFQRHQRNYHKIENYIKSSNLVKSDTDQESKNNELIKSMQIKFFDSSQTSEKNYRKDYINSISPESPGPSYYHLIKSFGLSTTRPSFTKANRFDFVKDVTPGPSEYKNKIDFIKKSPSSIRILKTKIASNFNKYSSKFSNYNLKTYLAKCPSYIFESEKKILTFNYNKTRKDLCKMSLKDFIHSSFSKFSNSRIQIPKDTTTPAPGKYDPEYLGHCQPEKESRNNILQTNQTSISKKYDNNKKNPFSKFSIQLNLKAKNIGFKDKIISSFNCSSFSFPRSNQKSTSMTSPGPGEYNYKNFIGVLPYYEKIKK